jgi:hypothetical protein
VLDAGSGRPGRGARRARRILAALRPDLPALPGVAALGRHAAEARRLDAREAVPLPPPPPLGSGRNAADPERGRHPVTEQPGCLGGPLRTYRRM